MGSDCPYEIRSSNTIGRYLVASRDLKARELIISEEPLIAGPTDEPDSTMCLGCCCRMTENQFSRCSRCHYPVCNAQCSETKEHAENECEIFAKHRVEYPPPYSCHIMNKSIIILRCLLLKEKDPLKWDQLMTQSDSRDSRRNRPNCITADGRILENFRKFLPGEGEFDEEDVLTLSGIVDVNAHAFPIKINGKVVSLRCHIYDRITLLAHSCSPNSSWAPSSSSPTALEIRTNVPLARGEIISVAYDDRNLLYGTLRRLIPMEISWMFQCKCPRCLDPTELGTYLSALKCQRCPQGYSLPMNPTDSFSDWQCDSCGAQLDEMDVSDILDVADLVGFPKTDVLMPRPDEDVAFLKDYISTFGGTVLHPNHYILQEVNLRIIAAQAPEVGELSDKDLIEFVSRCRKLLDISDVLLPGFGEYRAFLQYHYFKALLCLEKGKDDGNSCNSGKKSQESLKNYKKILSMQQDVLVFLQEKFTSHKRIDYIRETMGFVQTKIHTLKNGLS